jgi:hypothetical protein
MSDWYAYERERTDEWWSGYGVGFNFELLKLSTNMDTVKEWVQGYCDGNAISHDKWIQAKLDNRAYFKDFKKHNH